MLNGDNTYRAAEVQYYTQLAIRSGPRDGDEETWQFVNAACIYLFAPFDSDLDRLSYGTLKTCHFLGEESLTFIDIKTIVSVVGMVPHALPDREEHEQQHFFMVDMSKLDGAFNHPQADGSDADIDDMYSNNE